jgi:hypothetical protein
MHALDHHHGDHAIDIQTSRPPITPKESHRQGSDTVKNRNESHSKHTMTRTAISIVLTLLVLQDAESFAPNLMRTAPSLTTLKADRKPPFSVPEVDFSYLQNAFADFDISRLQDGIADFDLNQVVRNVRGDNEELGSRGEIYFAAQVMLISFIVIGGVPFVGEPLRAM